MSRALALAAVASLPVHGALVPGRSLGGVHLGETAAQVRVALGSFYGACLGCRTTTWYFTYRKFTSQGLAVELTGGRVSALYTLWQPPGWRAPSGLQLGAVEGQVTTLAGPLEPIPCAGYSALVRVEPAALTAYYIVEGNLWGFGLFGHGGSPCR